jgi:hypothetical protein
MIKYMVKEYFIGKMVEVRNKIILMEKKCSENRK